MKVNAENSSFVVADPRNVDAHPALAILCVAEPDPTFHFDANTDKAFLCGSDVDYDPDPASQNTICSRAADPNPNWIRIQSGQWIRIRISIPDPDPGE